MKTIHIATLSESRTILSGKIIHPCKTLCAQKRPGDLVSLQETDDDSTWYITEEATCDACVLLYLAEQADSA